jgi:uncharacterized Tic20 family protein
MSAAPPPYQPAPPPYQPAPPLSPQDQRLWATLTHVGGILFGVLAPLVTYLVFKDRGAFIAQHTRTALNFHLTALLAFIVSVLLTLVLIGILLYVAVFLLVVISGILAAVKANAGEQYEYPLTIRFVR